MWDTKEKKRRKRKAFRQGRRSSGEKRRTDSSLVGKQIGGKRDNLDEKRAEICSVAAEERIIRQGSGSTGTTTGEITDRLEIWRTKGQGPSLARSPWPPNKLQSAAGPLSRQEYPLQVPTLGYLGRDAQHVRALWLTARYVRIMNTMLQVRVLATIENLRRDSREIFLP